MKRLLLLILIFIMVVGALFLAKKETNVSSAYTDDLLAPEIAHAQGDVLGRENSKSNKPQKKQVKATSITTTKIRIFRAVNIPPSFEFYFNETMTKPSLLYHNTIG